MMECPNRTGIPPRSWWLHAYLISEWRALCAGAAMMFARAGVLLLLPWPLKIIIDNVIFQRKLNPLLIGLLPDPVGRRMDLLNALGLGMLTLGLVDALLVYFGNRLLLNAGQRIVAAIRFDLFAHLQRLSLDFHRRNHGGELMERLGGDVRQIQDFIAAIGIDLLPHAMTIIGMAGVMLLIDWRFAIVAISAGPLLMLIARYFSNRMRSTLRQVRDQETQLAAKAQEVLDNVQVVQAFAREDYEEARYRDEASKCIAANLKANEIQAKFGPAVSLTIAVSTGLIAWFGAVTVIRGALSPGELLIFLAYLAAMATPARQLAKTGRVFGRSVIALERIGECRAERATVIDSPAAEEPSACAGYVSLKNIVFGYQPGSPVLRDISFSMEPGTTVALVGQTGSGKSTIAGLIPRFFDPGQGQILVDGRDSKTLPLSFLRRQVALVLQEPLLFQATVWENIAYGRHGAGYAEAVAAARAVGVDDILERLPAGFDTMISEGGKSLSGGQRQCVSVARAMLSNAPIVILDEPSSSLDASTEHRLMLALRRLSANRSALIIAHRLATITHADLILVLDQGRIVERGRHAELLVAGKIYADLWRASRDHRDHPKLRLVNE
jgi:ATP-binding cassette subfamily B protein